MEIPEDAALPWPDVPQIERWWDRNRSRFDASSRYFAGTPLGAAALHLSLLEPGTPHFNTSAPARRQREQLAIGES